MKKTLGFVFALILLVGGFYYFANNQVSSTNLSSLSQDAEARREPAANLAAQQEIVDQMNTKILSIRNRDDVKRIAGEVFALAQKPESKIFPAVQMYGFVASLVPMLEGVVYRCRSFVETSDWLHMASLFGLRDFKYNNYLYGVHIDAIFDFLTYPSEAAGKPFQTVSELQDFFLFQIGPRVEAGLKMMAELEKLPSQNFEFNFDRTILVGQSNGLRFIDPEETKKLFIKPNFYTMTFLLQRALGTIYYAGAMDLNELPIVYNAVLRKTGINNFVGKLRVRDLAKGITPEMTYETIKGTESFLTWRKEISNKGTAIAAQQLLDRSFQFGIASAQNQLAAYVCGLKYTHYRSRGTIFEINDKSKDCMSLDGVGSPKNFYVTEGSKYLFDPNSMILDFKQKYNMFRERYRAYVEANQGKYAKIISDVTGKSIEVNIKALFSTKFSQRDFLPTGYTQVSASSQAAGLPKVHAWNYDHGKPMTFKDYTFGGFFNGSEVKDSATLYQTMATLLYTDAVAPFAIFIRVPSTARYFIPPSEIIRQ